MLKFCSAAWDTVHILWDGRVSTCLCPGWHSKGFIGNLNQNTLLEICNTLDAQDMQNSVLDQSFKYCRKDECHRLYSLEEVINFDVIKTYPKLPINLNLSIDKNCNLKCASCRTGNIYSKDINPQAQQILNQLVEAYKDFDQTVRIYCDASGDIFASSAYQEFFRRDDLPECFEFCLQTNGNLVTKNMDILVKLKDQIDIMIVSFDAATSDTYKDIRGGNFELVVEGVRQMIEAGIKVSTQFVVQYKNHKEILDYVDLCKSVGVNHIGLQKLDRWHHMDITWEHWWKENRLDNNSKIDYDYLISTLVKLNDDPIVGLCGGLENLVITSKVN